MFNLSYILKIKLGLYVTMIIFLQMRSLTRQVTPCQHKQLDLKDLLFIQLNKVKLFYYIICTILHHMRENNCKRSDNIHICIIELYYNTTN